VIRAEEVERRVGLVSDDRAVVWNWSDVKQVASMELPHVAVVEGRGGAAGQDHPDVFHATTAQTE
jgi:hypothetical protein